MRMGARLQHRICSHVNIPYPSSTKGSQMLPLWLKITAGPTRKRHPCRSCEPRVVVGENKLSQKQTHAHIGENLRFTGYQP